MSKPRRRPRTELRPYKDKSKGRWYVVVDVVDGRKVRLSGATEEEAYSRAVEAIDRKQRGLPTLASTMTVAALCEVWLADRAESMAPTSVRTFERVVRLYLVPYLGSKTIRELTAGDVSSAMRAMARRGLSTSTQGLAKRTLGNALRWAEQRDLVHRNVARIAEAVKQRRTERSALSLDEAPAVLQAALDLADEQQVGKRSTSHGSAPTAVAVALLLGLRWVDVDLDGGSLHVRQQLQRLAKVEGEEGHGLQLLPLKTPRSRRTLPLDADVVALLRAVKARQAACRELHGDRWADEHGLVFTTDIGTPIDGRNFLRVVHLVCDRAGVERRTIHELRHSCGSLLYKQGVPMKTISETLGHRSTRVTEDVYVHVKSEDVGAALGGLSSALFRRESAA